MGRERNDFPPFEREPPRLDGSTARTARLPEEQKPERDWKRGFLIFGLGALSWVATYVGMLELIEANMGSLPLIHRVIIGFSVAMLMTMIIWLLDQLFKPHAFLTKTFYAFGYVFLSIISIGFGFGFYWKVLESHGEASRSAESAVGQVQGSLHAASTRLEQLQGTLIQLTAVSTQKAELERTKGTSCPNSKPGDGPRRKLREEDAQRFHFSSEFVKGRVAQVKTDMGALDGDLAKIVSNDASTIDLKSGTRNEFMRALSRKLDMTVTGFNAFRTDPQLKQLRTDLADRAERTTFADSHGGTFACPDAQLQTALRGVVKAIDQLPELEKPQVAAVEGSEATIEAFRRLTTTFYGLLSFKLPPSADELRDLQKKAVQSVESPATAALQAMSAEQGGLSKRDYVPLAVAMFVDLCLFLVSMVQRPASRLSGLMPKMQAAERGPVIEILSRFNDIHKDQEIRENFEIFRHVVFDMHGDYYVAVPLDAPPRLNPTERETLRVEAQLLANLFSSFEKERIFKRTMLPTTASIQKRLKRQGSKFAGAEAFRVYKFTDGAWSDIILGAVMGAARRSENEKRVFPRPRRADSLHDANVTTIDRGPTAPLAPPPQAVTNNTTRNAMAVAAPAAPPRQPPQPVDPRHAARFGPYATAYPQRPPLDARAPQSPRVPRPAPPPHPEAEVTVKGGASPPPLPANDDLAAAVQDQAREDSRKEGVVIPLERPIGETTAGRPAARNERDEKLEPLKPANVVDVTLARETATFSVPMNAVNMTSANVSGGFVPSSLKAALAKAGIDNDLLTCEELRDPATSHDVPDEPDVPSHQEDEEKANVFSARDLALISRMAPPAAE